MARRYRLAYMQGSTFSLKGGFNFLICIPYQSIYIGIDIVILNHLLKGEDLLYQIRGDSINSWCPKACSPIPADDFRFLVTSGDAHPCRFQRPSWSGDASVFSHLLHRVLTHQMFWHIAIPFVIIGTLPYPRASLLDTKHTIRYYYYGMFFLVLFHLINLFYPGSYCLVCITEIPSLNYPHTQNIQSPLLIVTF